VAAVEFIYGRAKITAVRQVLKDASTIVVISAFATTKGLSEISEPVLSCVKNGGKATLLLGLDRRVASAELIEQLGDLLRKTTKASGRLEIALVVEAPGSFLHAKVFAAKKKSVAEMLVGSFNLTSKGLTENHEFAARLTGSASAVFDDLLGFIASIPSDSKRVLTLEKVDELIKALVRRPAEVDSEQARRRREDAQRRLAEIFKAIPEAALNLVDEEQSERHLARLLRDGAFYNYQIDLEKLAVPSGLNKIYEAGLLKKEKSAEAGTFKVKRATAVTASAPLVPEHRRRAFRAVSVRLGKALSKYGFETPFGYWIPKPLEKALVDRVTSIGGSLPSGAVFESEVREFVKQHHEKLEETTRMIVDQATEGGIEHPEEWRAVRDSTLAEIKGDGEGLTEDEWRGSSQHARTIDWIRTQLLSVREKLDADLAIGKLRRIRPDLIPIPLDPFNLSRADVCRLLECMVWAVAEDRGKKKARPAVHALSRRLGAEGAVKASFEQLQSLSEALLEGAEGAERGFFHVFGPPPYWRSVDGHQIDTEEEVEDVDDE
jgi:HKD family nuclease